MAIENVYVMPDGSIKPCTRGRPPKGSQRAVRDVASGNVQIVGAPTIAPQLTKEETDYMVKQVEAEKANRYADVSLDEGNAYIALAPVPVSTESASEPIQVVSVIPSPFDPITWIMEAGKPLRKL